MKVTHHSARVGGRITRIRRIDEPFPYSQHDGWFMHETGWFRLEPHYVQLCETKPGVFRVVEVSDA